MNAPFSPARIGFALLFALVTYLTLTPNPDDLKQGMPIMRFAAQFLFGDAAFADKIAHFMAYGALGFLGYYALGAKGQDMRMLILAAPFALGAYGAALEGVQGVIGARSPELFDALANAVGALAGFWSGAILVYLFKAVK